MSAGAWAPGHVRRVVLAPMLVAAMMAPGLRAQAAGPDALPAAAIPAGPQPAPKDAATGPAVPTAPIFLNHPAVVDTAHLKGGDTAVTLFGVLGWGGDPARSLQSFIVDNGDRVTCRPRSDGSYVCMLPTGLDVAATALANGAAQTIADSPADYHEQEAAAQAAQLGIWAGLPPAPVAVQHPVVQTTADLAADGRIFTLAGLVGFNAPYYTLQLQNAIAARGDRLSCQQQDGGRYVCVLPDGGDIAAVALLAGIARVGPDAPQEYQADQAKAVAAKAGFWFDPPQPVLAQLTPAAPAPSYGVLAPGDLGGGIVYDNGIPSAIIGGEPVFFTFAGLAGWGFYDHFHRWHAAPEQFRAHLDRFHPGGNGLRGYDRGGLPGRVAAFRAPGSRGLEIARGPQVFNGPASYHTPASFHAPVVSPGLDAYRGVQEFRGAQAFNRGIGLPHGEFRPQAIHPLGIGPVPGFTGARPGFNPGALQFRRSAAVPLLVQRPNFPAIGAVRPGVAPAPRIAAPAPGFLGRR